MLGLARSALCALSVAWALPAFAQAPVVDPTRDVDVIERLGERIPQELVFTDAQGDRVSLGEKLAEGKPVLLSLVYYRCPQLCGLVLGGSVKAIADSGLTLGKDFTAVTVSFDPTDGPQASAEQKRGYLKLLGRRIDDPAWSFLTGEQQEIHALADAVGFKYVYDGQSRQYAHNPVLFVLTPDGKLSRYLYGFDLSPRDLKLAMVEASAGRVGTSFDRFLLTCYQYDPAARRYVLSAKRFIQGGGLLVFLGLSSLLAVLWRRELKGGAKESK